jgi:hypothetical protein
MKARLTELNQKEILSYLGYGGQELTQELLAQIQNGIEQVQKTATPLLVYRRIEISEGQIKGFPMEGEDIRNLLAPCREGILMAATLGTQVERLIMRAQVTNMADAVILDACASAAIENVCDHFEWDLRDRLEQEGYYLTDRFSPGYGDLPLHTQQALCEALDTVRRIGLTVTDRDLMVPGKSVRAILGISEKPQTRRKRGCDTCSLFWDCSYRKEGMTCHG